MTSGPEAIPWSDGTVTAVISRAADPIATLVLGHGAGGSVATLQLARLGDAIATRGVSVVRFNFPYAERGRKTPGSAKEAVACFRDVTSHAAWRGTPTFIGGKSYGGRMASHLAADGFEAAGLVFVGYPLHAPGAPDRRRDAHLASIRAPMLFLQGTRDAFARLDLIEAVVAKLPTATLVLFDGGDHSFAVPGRLAADVLEEIAAAITDWIAKIV